MNQQQLDEFLDRYPGIGVRVVREPDGSTTWHAHGPAHLRAVLAEDLARLMPLGSPAWQVVEDARGTEAERTAAARDQRAAARLRLHGTPPPAPRRTDDEMRRLIPR